MKIYAVIGTPLSHSLSPRLHQAVFKRLGLPYLYIPWEVKQGQLKCALDMFRQNLAGFNVTAPHKEDIIPFLDGLDFSAELYGAVNTVKNEAGRLLGYNTDGAGFLEGLKQVQYEIGGKEVLILGAGGAAQTIAFELAHQGCSLTIANRTADRAQRLALRLERKFPGLKAGAVGLSRIPRKKYDCVLNATSLGRGELGGETPLHSQYLGQAELVYDLNYNPAQSKLLQLGQIMGAKTINGLPMLIYQGLKAEEIWLGRAFSSQESEQIYAGLKGELSAND
ncbi:MAG: shikimate dehydrogenase [Firmicutes bacterium]|nr:shikimate dehydrogenase [Bacillota bacterium]